MTKKTLLDQIKQILVNTSPCFTNESSPGFTSPVQVLHHAKNFYSYLNNQVTVHELDKYYCHSTEHFY